MRHALRHLTAAAGACLLAIAALPAAAQQLGTYSGTTSQGDSMSLTVAIDGNGQTAITGALFFWSATCKRSGEGRGVGWGTGADAVITNKKASYEFRSTSLYESVTATFNPASNTVTGTFLGHTPEFVDVANNVKKVELCDSGSLTFSASLQANGINAAPSLKAGQALQVQR